MKIKIFCDSADYTIIKEFNKNSMIKGFTTNPSLMRVSGAKNLGCSIITMPPSVIKKVLKFGKSFKSLTLDTVKTFLFDSKNSKFKI